MTLGEKIRQMQNQAPAIPRLGVPEYNWWSEALHGVAVNGIATVFPQAIGMAATWDPELIHSEADVVSTEARAKHNEAVRLGRSGIFQGLTFWSPNINIFRDPRWGRGQETFGEDPFLTSRIGVAFVRGLQGDDPKYFKVISTPKHFAVHSGPEQLRHRFDARTTGRDLYETYLPAFEACITEGGAYSIMGAYNRYEGVPCTASTLLLVKNLRERWKFPGYVVSDCGAITDIFAGHGFAKDAAEASALGVKAGCDLTCGDEYTSLAEAVSRGLISEKEIDVAVRRLMTARFRLGMFDPAESVPYARIPFQANDTPEHRALALDVARESIVLLRNAGNALPLKKGLGSIAVIGPAADDLDVLLGNYNGTPSHPVTLLQGIREKVGEGTNVRYARGCEMAEGMAPPLSPVPSRCLSTGEGGSRRSGLNGEYFNNMQLSGPPSSLRVDSTIDFTWENPPAAGVPHDGFSARWTGRITPAVSGTYYFGVTVDDGVRMYVDGKLFLEDWHDGGSRRIAKEIAFHAGESHEIKLEYYQDGGAAVLQLGWMLNNVDPAVEAVALARESDQIIAVMGISPLLEGEEMSVSFKGFAGGDRTDITLPGPQRKLLDSLVSLGKPIVLVLTNGSALALPWESEHIGGILEAWYPGEEGGRAVADILFGDYNPAGKLPVTFYRSVEDIPPFESYGMEGRTYRYFRGKPVYPFGYGLSYTHFEYEGATVSQPRVRSTDSVIVQVTLANRGERAGDEVVQIYVTGPDTAASAPIRSLKAFTRIHLKKGEEKSASLTLRARDLRVYDESLDRYVVRPGVYRLGVGGSSGDLPLSAEVRVGD
jgi:beta-glucosidase